MKRKQQRGPVAATQGRKRKSRRKLAAAALALSAPMVPAHAAPAGGQVVSGSGSISQSGGTTTVNQTSHTLSLNWNSFNVGKGESVNFVQPSATALAVNRIFDSNGSQILGRLTANGQVWLINPNGILFGPGAQVNVGGLVASTLDLDDASLAGNARSFSGKGSGSVVNQGSITAADGGYVAFLGNQVSNQGNITAPLGSVALGAGNAATLTFSGNSLVKLQVDQSVLNSLAENGGLIRADGGMVVMNAGAKDALLASVVNNTGVIEARTVENHKGTITLLGGMAAGQANVGGKLDASAPNGGDGGFIETSAARVTVADGAKVSTLAPAGKTGAWLIDPTDFTIGAGSAAQNTSGIGADTLSNMLASTGVTIATAASGTGNGDIHVNSAVSWNANQLTLSAHNNININADLNGSGTARLALEYGQGTPGGAGSGYFLNNGARVNLPAGPNFSTRQGSGGTATVYTVINDLGVEGDVSGTTLQGMQGNLGRYYALGSDIEAAATVGWNGGAGFAPIGSDPGRFTGTLDGLGHVIRNLTVNRPASDYVGLFGFSDVNSMIRNVGLASASIRGLDIVGGLVGANGGTVSNSYATGSVSTDATTGGIYVGGLVGANVGMVSNSYAAGSVVNTGTSGIYTGGLVGLNGGQVINSYATGNVSGNSYIGGLVGYNDRTNGIQVINSYATGSVSGNSYVGGLVGYNIGTVSDSYATGNVTGVDTVGSLVGYNSTITSNNIYYSGTVSNSYAMGRVTGTTNVGGLAGRNDGTVSSSYWDSSVNASMAGIGSDYGTTTGVVGLDTQGMPHPSMLQQSSFSGWDFVNTWVIYKDRTTPLLRSFMTPLTVTANDAIKTYDGQAYVYGGSAPNMSNVLGTLGYDQAINAGIYAIGGLYSNQQGYIINYAGGTLTINRAPLTVAANDVTRNYDGTAFSGGAGVSYSGFVNGENTSQLSGTLSYGGNANNARNAGTYAIAPSGLNATNYDISYVDGRLTIDKALLTVTVNANNKVYDGTTAATVALNDNRVTGDVLNVASTSANFADKNVGTGKTVTVTGLSLSGMDAGNYALTSTSVATTADITARTLVATATANNKVYDGNTTATVALADDRVAGDVLTLANTAASFSDKNAGMGKTVTVSGLSISGADAGNYMLASTSAAATADITARPLTVTASANNKVYDGTTTATVSLADNRVAGDVLAVANASADFADKNAGTGKTVTVAGLSHSGTDANNYVLASTSTTATADITARSLTATAAASSKVYDGTTTAIVSLSDNRVAGDALTVASTSANFADKNVGTGKAVAVAGLSLSGTDASNYVLASTSTATTADIAARTLTATAVGNNKVYDGNTSATVSLGDNRITGDVLTIANAGASFADKNVGTGKTVTVTGLSLSGADAGNYILASTTAAATGDITARTLTATATASNKVYDGTTAATVSLADNRVAGDVLTVANTGGRFADKNVGSGKAVTVAGLSLSGADAGNYVLASTNAVTTADITARTLTATANAGNKIYDGTTASTVTLGDNRVTGDVLTVANTGANFSDKNVGTGKTVTVAGLSISGTDAGNYVLASTKAATAADITPAALTVSGITAVDKVYDGGTAATVNTAGVNLQGLVRNDDVRVSVTGAFADKNAGSNKTVNLSSSYAGADVANYSIAGQTTTTASIAQASLAVTGVTAADKVYDGNRTATLTGVAMVSPLTGDSVTVAANGLGTFADKNVGNGKAVMVSGFTLAGTDAANYAVVQPAGVTASITPAALTVSGITANDKVYDGTTAATVNTAAARLQGLVAGDQLNVNATGAFTDKNAGSNKTVVLSSAYSGADVGNYVIAGQNSATASITPATLAYTAAPASFVTGQAPYGLSGTVSGFAAGDTLAGATTGMLSWATTAGAASPPGQYAINGSGLSAANYVFAQAPGNASALTVQPGQAPEAVRRATAQLESAALAPQANAQPGGNDPVLQVLYGGVRLPDNMVNVNE